MRNSFATPRTPHYCQHSRYTPGVGVEGCTFRHEHDGKHSFDKDSEADEEGDMRPRDARQEAASLACDESVTCPADFHTFTCQAYRREQTQQAPGYHHFVGRDGTVATTYPDGSIKVVTPMGKETRIPPLDEETKQRLRAERGSWPSADERAKFILEERAKKTLTIHTSEGKPEGRAEVSHHTAGGMETIDFIYAKLGIDGGHDYVLGNILKYAARAKYKGQFESDVEKIRNYAVIMQEQEAKREDKTNG